MVRVSIEGVLLMVLLVQGAGVFSQELSESEGNQITFPTLVGTPDLELTLPMHLSISEPGEDRPAEDGGPVSVNLQRTS